MLQALGSGRFHLARLSGRRKGGDAVRTRALASLALIPLAPLACGSRTGLTDSSGPAAGLIGSCEPGGPGVSDCGQSRENCCLSLEVPAGAYYRTYTNVGAPIDEADPATISGFRLDKYEVTVGRFRRFASAWRSGWRPQPGGGRHVHLNAGHGLVSTLGGTGPYEPGWAESDDGNVSPTDTNLECDTRYATWTNAEGNTENRAITCVNWYEAYAFCIWDGGFLPTEAEIEYAAAGGSEQREYPWGPADPGTTNQYALYGCYYPDGTGVCTGLASIAPVGTAPLGLGAWGQADLAGNVWQWDLDWYGAYGNPCSDCANLVMGLSRVIRGGNFSSDTSSLLPANRSDFTPIDRSSALGFRCARVP